MNREILFRGKRKDNGEWVFGSLIVYVDRFARCPKTEAFIVVLEKEYKHKTNFDKNRDKNKDLVRDAISYEVIPETVGQYAGLKDKNGKEIFEGDIISSEHHRPKCYKIEFIEGGFCATHPDLEGYPLDINHFYPSVGCEIEVIGNITDNPELLK